MQLLTTFFSKILEALGDYLKIKTMIFCLNSEEAKELSDFLVSNSIETLLIHEETVITKIHGNVNNNKLLFYQR